MLRLGIRGPTCRTAMTRDHPRTARPAFCRIRMPTPPGATFSAFPRRPRCATPLAMLLDVLPVRTANAPENMAHDFLLLQRYPEPGRARFRHYDWRGPAWTFGYSQKIAFVRAQLPVDARDFTRRATGGGVVDHTDDWTYALVIPRGHALYDARATESYRVVHQALADALVEQAIPAELEKRTATAEDTEPAAPSPAGPTAAGAAGPAGVCFHRAEIYDVVHTASRAKIAGAAQKRNKHGLLLQGSLWKPSCAAPVDWDAFHDAFTARLATTLAAEVEHPGWPEFNYDEEQALIDQYTSTEWIEYR